MKVTEIAEIVAAGGIVDLGNSSELLLNDLLQIAAASHNSGGLIFNAGSRSSRDILKVVRSAPPGRVQVRI